MTCAWCGELLRDRAVTQVDHGVPYHLGCWARREVLLRPDPVALADFVVDELGDDGARGDA